MDEPDTLQDGQPGEQHGDTTADLDRGAVFTLLKNPRRRAVLRHLEDTPETTLAELADRVAAEENDTTPELLSSSDRKRVYISLYQSHLPKLAEFGVIEYDQSRGDVVRQPAATRLQACLRRVDGDDDDRLSTVAHAVGGVVAVAVLAGTLLAPATAAAWALGGGVTLLGLCLSESLDGRTLAWLRDRLGRRGVRRRQTADRRAATAGERTAPGDGTESEPAEAARNSR